MGNPAKKIKLTMDPIERMPVELHDLIFQHLSGNEVMKASEVSKDWNRAVTNSKTAMGMQTLKLNESNSSKDDLKVLMATKRKYVNLAICKSFKLGNRRAIFSILEKFKGSLERIATDFDVRMHELKMEKLKNVDLTAPVIYKDGILTAAPNMKVLYLMVPSITNSELIFNCENLKFLRVSCNIWRYLMNLSPQPPIKFKLDRINWCVYVSVQDTSNYMKFLRHQASSLTSVYFEVFDFTSQHFLDAIMGELPALKELDINVNCKLALFFNPPPKPSLSITHFIYTGDSSSLAWLLKYLPNVTRMELSYCNRSILRYVLRKVPKLKLLEIIEWGRCSGGKVYSEEVSLAANLQYAALIYEDASVQTNVKIEWKPWTIMEIEY